MARNEQDREDLFAEATALSPCWELEIEGVAQPVVAGFRDTGNLSVYFGSDPVFHFDHIGRLRRSFSEGALYRSEGRTLCRLLRNRTADASTLYKHVLTPDECQRQLDNARSILCSLHEILKTDRYLILRSRDADTSQIGSLVAALSQITEGSLRLSPPLRSTR